MIKQNTIWIQKTPSHPFQSQPSAMGNRSSACQHHRLILPALELYINGILQRVILFVWLSLNFIFVRLIYAAPLLSPSIVLGCVTIPGCIYPFFSWLIFGLFQVLRGLTSSAAMNILTDPYDELRYPCLMGASRGAELLGAHSLILVNIAKTFSKSLYNQWCGRA